MYQTMKQEKRKWKNNEKEVHGDILAFQLQLNHV